MNSHFFLTSFLVLLLLAASANGRLPEKVLLSEDRLKDSTLMHQVLHKLPLSAQVEEAERIAYIELRNRGYDEVSNSVQARMLRNYRLRNIKTTGLFRKKQTSLAQILFPASHPVAYYDSPQTGVVDYDSPGLVVTGNLLQSKRSLAMYDILAHPAFINAKYAWFRPTTLGARLEGYGAAFKKLPFDFVAKRNRDCTLLVTTHIHGDLDFLRHLVKEQYRIHF